VTHSNTEGLLSLYRSGQCGNWIHHMDIFHLSGTWYIARYNETYIARKHLFCWACSHFHQIEWIPMDTCNTMHLLLQWNLSTFWAIIPDLIIQVATLHRSLCMYVNDTFGDYFNGQFRQVTILYSDLIRQVSLYIDHAQSRTWSQCYLEFPFHGWFFRAKGHRKCI